MVAESLLMSSVVAILVMIAVIAFEIVCSCLWFRKMGLAPWAALIPYYSQYVQSDVAMRSPYPLVMLVANICLSVITCAHSDSGIVALLQIVVTVIYILLYIVMIDKISAAFGHGHGWTALTVIFPLVMIPIMALSGSQEFDEDKMDKSMPKLPWEKE